MLRKILATAILVASLHAEVEKFQILANNLNTKDDIVIATGNVVAFSPTYYITAQKAIYDKKKGTFELFDDVVVLKNNNVQTKSDYSFIDLNTDDSYQKPSLYFEESNSIWISSKDSVKKNDVVHLKSSTLSSCDCVDPDWSIKFSSADYDTKDMWINLYNSRIYFKDIPILYSPFIGFSTDTRRRTGLLIPTVGYSSKEGAFYSQPIYIAPADNYDIELIPVYKTNRGVGMQSYFRYADSIDSMFQFSFGYFKDYKSYQEENGLLNQEHYGIGVNYVKNSLFSPNKFGYDDGLYVDINYLNDVEYQNIDKDFEENDESKKVESKINYVYSTPNYYLGSYFRYYIDTSKDSNSTTLQELPKLQAHSFARPLFLDRLLYSTDLKYTNHERDDGINAQQYEFNVPISYSFDFFDDYLKLVLKQEFSFNKYTYSNSDLDFEDGTYVESKSTISLNTDLVKPYDNYIHTANLFTNFNHVDTIEKEGDLYDPLLKSSNSYSVRYKNSLLSSFPVSKAEDSIEFGINHSLYDKEDLKQIVNHKLNAVMKYDDYDQYRLQDIENEIKYNYILGSIRNKLIYNYQDKQIVESSSSFSLNYENFYLRLGHYLSKDTENSDREDLESYTLFSRYKLSDKYSLSYYTNYNLEEDIRTKHGISLNINESCWNLDLRYEREIEASSNVNKDYVSQDILYVQLFLKPLGGIKQQYTLRDEENSN